MLSKFDSSSEDFTFLTLWPWIYFQQGLNKWINELLDKYLCLEIIFTFCVVSPWFVFVVVAELVEEASRPAKNTKSLSTDLIEYVQHMIREHKDNFKVRVGMVLSTVTLSCLYARLGLTF